MFYKKEGVLGFFVPSFFYISLNTSANSLPELNDEEKATYTHEYIHFMQDTTTAFGISRLIFSIHQLCNLFYNVNDCANFDECLLKYYELLDSNSDERSTLNEFMSEYCDDKINNTSCGTLLRYKLNANDYSVILQFENLNNLHSPYQYRFSSCDIEEGMASFIQRKIFHTNTDSIPRFPYKIMEEVVSHIVPDRITDVMLIQISDLALQSTNPGYAFIKLLGDVKNGISVERLWDDGVEVLARRDGRPIATYKAYDACINIVNGDAFKDALRCSYGVECRKDIYDYIFEVCSKGAIYRQEKKQHVFSELLDINKYTIAQKINLLHKSLDAPNIFRTKDNYYFGAFAEHQKGAAYLPILNTLIRRTFLDDNKLVCPYWNTCSENDSPFNKVFNDNCKNNFLLNIVEGEELCMATALAKSMGITSTFNDQKVSI